MFRVWFSYINHFTAGADNIMLCGSQKCKRQHLLNADVCVIPSSIDNTSCARSSLLIMGCQSIKIKYWWFLPLISSPTSHPIYRIIFIYRDSVLVTRQWFTLLGGYPFCWMCCLLAGVHDDNVLTSFDTATAQPLFTLSLCFLPFSYVSIHHRCHVHSEWVT